MTPLVTILIPVYNRESIVAETIQSALDQTHKNIEVVLVDNASTDNTWQIIQSFAEKDSRIKAFRNETNLGPVRNWLRCVDEATGEYGKILWSDDLIAHDFIEKTLPLFDDDTAFVYTGVKIFSDIPGEGNSYYFIGKTGHRSTDEYINRALIDNNVPVSPGCAIFRLEDLKKNLLLNIDNKINSDFSMHAIGNDLMLFLLTANEYRKFGFVAEPLSFFRAHKGSISISSVDGKLPLHYMLVRSNFAENYKKEMVARLAAVIWLLLKKYPEHRVYGINGIEDFFKQSVNLSFFELFRVVAARVARLPLRVLRKIYRILGDKK